MTRPARYFVVGGAGFIGSHLVDRLLTDPAAASVTVFDNLSSGREWHLSAHRDDGRLALVRSDAKDLARLTAGMRGTTWWCTWRPTPTSRAPSASRRSSSTRAHC